MNLRQGNEGYANRVANAMSATDNLLFLSRDSSKVGQGSGVKAKGTRRVTAKVNNSDNNGGATAMVDMIDRFAVTGNNEEEGNIAEALLGMLTGEDVQHNVSTCAGKVTSKVVNRSNRENRSKEKTLMLLDNIKKCITGEQISTSTETQGVNLRKKDKGNWSVASVRNQMILT